MLWKYINLCFAATSEMITVVFLDKQNEGGGGYVLLEDAVVRQLVRGIRKRFLLCAVASVKAMVIYI